MKYTDSNEDVSSRLEFCTVKKRRVKIRDKACYIAVGGEDMILSYVKEKIHHNIKNPTFLIKNKK